jgi:surface polysaccharide O-acyltransferase-like enzyme
LQKEKMLMFKCTDTIKNRRPIFDYIRVLACIGVIGIHATGDRSDIIGLFMENLFRIGLTMFFLMTGALNLPSRKKENLGAFYKKTFKRLVIPLFIYGLLYSEWLSRGHRIIEIPTKKAIIMFLCDIPKGILINLASYQSVHLWFMYEIIGLYLIIPFIRKGIQTFEKKFVIEIVIVIFLLMACSDYLPAFGQGFGISNYFDRWIIYLILGYALMQDASIIYYKWIAIVGFISYIGSVWLKYAHAGFASKILNYYDLAPHMMLQTCGLFALFFLLEKVVTRSTILNFIVYKIGKYTFAVYLIHMHILQWWIGKYGINTSITGTIYVIICVFSLSLVFAIVFDNIVTFNIQRLFDLLCRFLKRLSRMRR